MAAQTSTQPHTQLSLKPHTCSRVRICMPIPVSPRTEYPQIKHQQQTRLLTANQLPHHLLIAILNSSNLHHLNSDVQADTKSFYSPQKSAADVKFYLCYVELCNPFLVICLVQQECKVYGSSRSVFLRREHVCANCWFLCIRNLKVCVFFNSAVCCHGTLSLIGQYLSMPESVTLHMYKFKIHIEEILYWTPDKVQTSQP